MTLTKEQQAQFDAAMAIIEAHRPDVAAVIRQWPIENTNDHRIFGQWEQDLPHKYLINFTALKEPVDIATVLVHEAKHTVDDLSGWLESNMHGEPGSSEYPAYLEGAKFWGELYPHGKYPEVDKHDSDSNELLEEYQAGTLQQDIRDMYANPFFGLF